MIKLMRSLTKKEWALAAVSLVFIVSQVWLDLTMPEYMSEITLLIQSEGSAMSEILTSGGKMLLCALGSLAASIVTFAKAALKRNVCRDL